MIAQMAQPDGARAFDVILGHHRHGLAARQPDEDRHRRQADGDHRVGQRRPEEGGQRDGEDQEGCGQKRLGDARDHGVGPAAQIARQHAQRDAEAAPRWRPRRRPPEARPARPRSCATAHRARSRRCRTRCAAEGALRTAPQSVVGRAGDRAAAAPAAPRSRRTHTMTPPRTAAEGCERNLRPDAALRAGQDGLGRGGIVVGDGWSFVPHARVQDAVGRIGQDVHRR